MGSQFGSMRMTIACPTSCVAVLNLSSGVTTRLFFSGPQVTRFMASEMSSVSMALSFLRVASMAASFKMFSRSAPVMPGVSFAILFRSTSSAMGLDSA